MEAPASPPSIFRTAAEALAADGGAFPALPTGDAHFDALLGGGLPLRGLVELCGEAGSGKTQLCIDVVNTAQTDPTKTEYRHYGMDCISGKVQNNLVAGIIEPALSKVKMIQFATEAAITVLRIDDMIKLAPEEPGQ